MKKVLIVAAILTVAITSQAFAAATHAPTVGEAGYSLRGSEGTVADDSTLIGKLSKGVYAGWNISSQNYAIVTLHESGSQSYGTADNSTSLYRMEGKAGQPAASDSAAFEGATESWVRL